LIIQKCFVQFLWIGILFLVSLLLIPNFILLWSVRKRDCFNFLSLLLYDLGCDLFWSCMTSWEKFVICHKMKYPIKAISSKVLCSCRISLLIFCLYVFSTDESGVLWIPTIIVSGQICSFKLRSICFMSVRALIFEAYIFRIIISSSWILPLLVCSDLLQHFWLILV
jgi:hypothetical protein